MRWNVALLVRMTRIGLALLWRFGMCLYEDGRWNEAESAFSQVMEARKRVLGPEHPDTLTSLNCLHVERKRQNELNCSYQQLIGKPARVSAHVSSPFDLPHLTLLKTRKICCYLTLLWG